jgi:hypothetical protein
VNSERRALATHLIDQLDGAMAELGHWLATGERVKCEHCGRLIPASVPAVPARHRCTGRCCDSHNIHCEAPGDLCCRDCTEAAHDSFPTRHADGSRCVLDPPEEA